MSTRVQHNRPRRFREITDRGYARLFYVAGDGDAMSNEHGDRLNGDSNEATGEESRPPHLSVGWHSVNDGQYYAYWDGSAWSAVSAPSTRTANTAGRSGNNNDASKDILNFLWGVVAFLLIAFLAYMVMKSQRSLGL